MRLEILEVEQNTPAWYACRAGMPTASCFKHILAKGRGGEPSKTRAAYLYRLADEVLYGDPIPSEYSDENMERGHEWQPQAEDIYQLENDVHLQKVGFVLNRDLNAGCSPDALIGTEGILEIKTSLPRLWLPYVLKGGYPPEHTPQIQGELLVTGRAWVDLMIYWPNRRPYIKRIERDDTYIRELNKALLAFNGELEAIVAALRTKFDLKSTLEAAQ